MNKKNIWKLLIRVIIIYVLFELIANSVGSIMATYLNKTLLYGKYTIYTVTEFIVFICSLILLFITNKFNIFKKHKLSFKESIKLCMPIVVLSCLVLLSNISSLDNINIENFLSLFIYTIFIGLFEEVFFRGIIEEELLENYSSNEQEVITSIVISGLIFGAIHLTNLLMGQDLLSTLLQFIQTSAIGILFGTIYYKTRNIWSLIFLHGFYDFAVLLSEVNLPTSCAYVSSVPISITLFTFISTIILSVLYIVYAIKLYEESKGKYNILIGILIALFFISSVFFSIFGLDINDYYICPEYTSLSVENYETHYYSYNEFEYVSFDDTIYHVYMEDSKAYIEDSFGNKTKLDILDVDRLVLIDNYLLVITNGSQNDYLYVLDMNDLSKDLKTYEVPFITSVGYLYDIDNNIKYPLIKSYISDNFVLDNDELKEVIIKN